MAFPSTADAPRTRAPFGLTGIFLETGQAFVRHMSSHSQDDLSQLGGKAALAERPEDAVLETVANPRPGSDYVVRFTCPEFTCLCPVTGQPDFAHFVIDYLPAERILESKSLKLYLHSFRNYRTFHEDCTVGIAERLTAAVAPQWLRMVGYWYPRGGIPIDVFYQSGAPPAEVWIPDPGVAPYRGRG